MSPPLTHLVSRFIDAFTASLEAAADPELQPFIESVRGISHAQAAPIEHPFRDHPALRFLDSALVAAQADERLCSAVRAIAPYLSYGSSYALEGPTAVIGRGMVWGEVAGRTGLVCDPTRRLGCFLLSPGLHYPLHGHVADEIYFVVSGPFEVEYGLDGARRKVPPGSYYRTPSGQPHALHIGQAPVLLVYCWVGDFAAPVWFLEPDGAGGWRKSLPEIVRR